MGKLGRKCRERGSGEGSVPIEIDLLTGSYTNHVSWRAEHHGAHRASVALSSNVAASAIGSLAWMRARASSKRWRDQLAASSRAAGAANVRPANC